MKEKIYTIPVNDAYDTDCECPLCHLEDQLEREAVDYELGAAMMEADHREQSDKTGFCRRHFEMMFEKPNKLSLALVLDTHLEKIRKELEKFDAAAKKLAKDKPGLFKKSGASDAAAEVSGALSSILDGCMVCEKIDHTMNRYVDVLLYMWANDPAFREKFDRSKGVCLKHFKVLADNACKSLSAKDASQFLSALILKEKSELERMQADIHKFTVKFDYRFKDMEWGTAYDAPIRTIEKITSYIRHDEEDKD
ncbi:MAG: DUF6062 family protein [Clostridiales bacterium]|nr:DUF6062 family protein [Clostridiales bacterium]